MTYREQAEGAPEPGRRGSTMTFSLLGNIPSPCRGMTCLVSFTRGQERHQTTEPTPKPSTRKRDSKRCKIRQKAARLSPSLLLMSAPALPLKGFMNHSQTTSSPVPLFHLCVHLRLTCGGVRRHRSPRRLITGVPLRNMRCPFEMRKRIHPL